MPEPQWVIYAWDGDWWDAVRGEDNEPLRFPTAHDAHLYKDAHLQCHLLLNGGIGMWVGHEVLPDDANNKEQPDHD